MVGKYKAIVNRTFDYLRYIIATSNLQEKQLN